MIMKKLMKEDGTFTDFGKAETSHLKEAINMVLHHADTNEMNIGELRTLGSLIAKMVGDAVSERLQKKKEAVNKLQAMSDEEFTSYLQNKYGDGWRLKTLTSEEHERCPAISDAVLQAALEEGRKHVKAFLDQQGSFMPPRGYFKKE